jgi:hypothetical protein
LEGQFPDELKELLDQIRKRTIKPLQPFPKVFDYLLDQLREPINNYSPIGIPDQNKNNLRERIKEINLLAEGTAKVLRNVLTKEQVIEN